MKEIIKIEVDCEIVYEKKKFRKEAIKGALNNVVGIKSMGVFYSALPLSARLIDKVTQKLYEIK